MRRGVASIVSLAAVWWAVSAVETEIPLVPMVSVEQGVTPHLIAGTAVFLAREGSTIVAFSPLTPGRSGDRLVWCPLERFFVSPVRRDLFDAEGRHVAGAATRDLDRYPVVVTQDLQVRVDIRAPKRRARSRGEVTDEARSRYAAWAANPDDPQNFCKNPVRA